MIKNNFLLLGLLASSSIYGMEEEVVVIGSASGYSSENLVEDELDALEIGQPKDSNIESDLLRKALRHSVFRTPEQREKLDKMAKDNPPVYQLLAQLFNQHLPTRTPGDSSEIFSKTPGRVRGAPSMKLDKEVQESLKKALEQYKLEKNYDQLKAYLETAHIENDDLRIKLAQAIADKNHYRKKYSRLKRELEKKAVSKQKKD